MQQASLGQCTLLRARSKANHGKVFFLYLGLSKGTLRILPVSWVWNSGTKLYIPACSARLTGPTGLGLTSDCWAIPIVSAQRQRADPNVHRLCSILVLGSPVVHAVSLGVAQHIAGNIFHEIFSMWVLADRGTVKGRVQDLWPVTVEGYRLDSATTGLGGLTLSMLQGPSRPHQVFQLLNGKAKETEWLCRALAFVVPQFNDQAHQCHRHISRVLALLLEFYVTALRSMHQKTLAIAMTTLAHWLSKGDGTL